MSRRKKKSKANFGRPPNVPKQQSQTIYSNSPYGSVVPFLQINNKKHTTPKPNALAIRNFAKNNTIVRRCINIIKDAIAKKAFGIKDIDNNDNVILKAVFNKIFSKPNDDDTARTFLSAITEDLVTGDCGCFEVAKCGNPNRPLFLFPVDGFSMEFVLGNDTVSFAQKQSTSIYDVSNNYKYFTSDEIIYLKKQVFTNSPFGLSPIETAFEYINALVGTFQYSADVASSALPKYMANIKNISPDMLKAYQAYFEQECMGRPNLPLVSSEDIESVQIAPISEEATFMGYQQFIIGIIAIAFGIPPEKLAIAKSNDRSKISEINENLLQDCILPYCSVIEESFNSLIDKLGYSDKVKFEFIHDETLEVKKIKQTMTVELLTNDVLTINETRAILGLKPLESEFANETISVMKAKVNEKYNTNGFNGVGSIKDTSDSQKGGGKNIE